MDELQFDAVMSGNPTVEELEAIMTENRRRSEEENRARALRDAEQRKQEEENKRAEKKDNEIK